MRISTTASRKERMADNVLTPDNAGIGLAQMSRVSHTKIASAKRQEQAVTTTISAVLSMVVKSLTNGHSNRAVKT